MRTTLQTVPESLPADHVSNTKVWNEALNIRKQKCSVPQNSVGLTSIWSFLILVCECFCTALNYFECVRVWTEVAQYLLSIFFVLSLLDRYEDVYLFDILLNSVVEWVVLFGLYLVGHRDLPSWQNFCGIMASLCANARIAMTMTSLSAAVPFLIIHSCHLMVCTLICGHYCLMN